MNKDNGEDKNSPYKADGSFFEYFFQDFLSLNNNGQKQAERFFGRL